MHARHVQKKARGEIEKEGVLFPLVRYGRRERRAHDDALGPSAPATAAAAALDSSPRRVRHLASGCMSASTMGNRTGERACDKGEECMRRGEGLVDQWEGRRGVGIHARLTLCVAYAMPKRPARPDLAAAMLHHAGKPPERSACATAT